MNNLFYKFFVSLLSGCSHNEFAVIELTVAENRRAAVHIHDGREPETTYHRQDIAWTDFPLEGVKLYIQQNGRERVVMLPSEY